MSIISYDKDSHQVVIQVPSGSESQANLLKDDLEAEFAFEGMDASTVKAMNDYAREWLAGRGVDCPPDLEEKA